MSHQEKSTEPQMKRAEPQMKGPATDERPSPTDAGPRPTDHSWILRPPLRSFSTSPEIFCTSHEVIHLPLGKVK